jgi:hypothetical protein
LLQSCDSGFSFDEYKQSAFALTTFVSSKLFTPGYTLAIASVVIATEIPIVIEKLKNNQRKL